MMASGQSWDTIVVGGGFGGLVCAAYLAAAGARVAVFEQHDVAGGNGHSFRRRRAYEFDVGVHYLGDCGPGGAIPAALAGLGLTDRVEFLPMDRDGFDRIELPGLAVDVPVGWDRYRDRVLAALPAEALGLQRYFDTCRDLLVVQRAGARGGDLAGLSRAHLDVLRWGRTSLAGLFEHCGLTPRARTVLAAQSGNYGTAPVDVTVSAHLGMLDHYLRGAAYPAGGGQVVVAALVEALEAHGGALFTRSAVQRVLVADGAVTGVRLADGSTHTAPVVVSNADYRRTVLDLVGPEHFPAALVRKTREARMRLGFSVLYVALDTELPRERNANLWWFRDDDIEAMYRDIDQDPVPDEVPFLFCSFASTKQPGPGICPPGHSNFQVMTLSRADPERWGLARGPADGGRYRREPAYLRHKQRTTNALLRAAEAALGPFREHVTHLETATPVTHERYTASTGGTPYGLANWGGLGARPDTRTPVAGLYVTGANTRTGSGVAGAVLGGLTCAGHVLGRPLLSEVLDGAVLADPHLLAARPPGWDALRVSRGRARRDAKGLAGVG